MERKISWRIGNKNKSNKTYDEIEKEKYDNAFSMKASAYVPIPPLDKISMPPSVYWVAKTNFKLTGSIVRLIEQTPGVEVLRPISPYSFVMSVNKEFFQDFKVISSINKKLNATAKRCNNN